MDTHNKADFAHNPEEFEQKIAKGAKIGPSLCFLCGLGVQVFLFSIAVANG